MGKSGILLGFLSLALGAVVAAGWVPGSDGWATGPRVGIAMALLALGGLLLALPAAAWLLARTTRPADYRGGCPVGATCACGHFNFKPRRACRECGALTRFS